MHFIRKIPATLALIVVNSAVFFWLYSKAGSFEEPLWSLGLLENGALYNPYTLGGQWQRIITSLFLHGNFIHLAFNMLALFGVGQDVERNAGTKKMLAVYFLSGIAGALGSLYGNLFQPGVGASGAIFGLFGFGVLSRIISHPQEAVPVVIQFIAIAAATVLVGEFMPVDHYAHIAGVCCGLLIAAIPAILKRPLRSFLPELVVAPILIIIFFSLPRFQVTYFNFFQKVLEAQDSTNHVLNNSGSMSNAAFLDKYGEANLKWDTAMNMLDAHEYLPPELHNDTFKLRRLIRYHKAEANYRMVMVRNESYIYADSIDIASDSIRKYTSLQYVLNMKYTPVDSSREEPDGPNLETVRVWYDTNWVEIPYPPAAYFRIGQKDSAGLWQGPLRDYFRNGNIQMKGAYKDDLKDGIFIYYTENNKYSGAGVYNEDQRVGKWETFHPNGRIESEVYYSDRYFLKSYWDSTGVQMVMDGNGVEIHKYPNGVVASQGEYVDGYQHGYWFGKHANGEMYFEENYVRGRLINGRSRSKTGKTFVYDESTLYALPVGGFDKLNKHISSQTQGASEHGTVQLSFRVTVSGQLTDFKTEKSVSKELDKKARQIILTGPRWLPARLHGQEPTDGFAYVSVPF